MPYGVVIRPTSPEAVSCLLLKTHVAQGPKRLSTNFTEESIVVSFTLIRSVGHMDAKVAVVPEIAWEIASLKLSHQNIHTYNNHTLFKIEIEP
jgi:hypothetical protein